MLARYKRACPLETPTAERFCYSAFLSEWLHAHITEGGRDPKVSRAEHLIADHDAPLKMAKLEKDQTKRRGNFFYAEEKWKEMKALAPEMHFSMDDYQEARRHFLDEFSGLAQQEEDEYNMKASVPGYDDPLRSELPMPKLNAYNRDGELLLGLSTEKDPINPTLAEELLQELLGVSQVGGAQLVHRQNAGASAGSIVRSRPKSNP